MQLTQLQDSNTLLTYSLMTTPSPVQVSPSASSPSLATLTFVVSCPRSVGTANVAQIIVAIPVDVKDKPADPTNLAATPPLLSSASITSTGTDEWVPAAGIAPGVFIFTPKGGGAVKLSDQSLTIAFTGIHVNALVGTALVRINEWAAPGDSTPPPINGAPSGAVSVEVPKFPYGFFAGNFATNKPMIENGQSAVLTWVGSVNATYKILFAKEERNVSDVRTWPSPGLLDTTTFILEVKAQAGNQSVTLYFSVTVIVANPSFTAKDLTVLTTSKLLGEVTVGKAGGPGANLILNGELNGAGNLNGKDITASGSLKATGNVNGTDITASANLKATGNVNGNDIIAAGSVTATKDLHVTGTGTITNVTVPGTVGTGYLRTNGMVTSNGIGVTGSFIRVDMGDNAAAGFYNNSSSPVIYAKNSHSNRGAVTGLNVFVATPQDTGVSSNGWVGSYSGSGMITRLPTRKGFRVVTSPLSVHSEVQASGSAKLTQGKATVQFEADVMDIILHTDEHAYRVLLTPTGQCNGLAVINKSGDNFIVAELNNGASDAGFDWFVIARKPEALGASAAAELPEKMAEMPDLDLIGPNQSTPAHD